MMSVASSLSGELRQAPPDQGCLPVLASAGGSGRGPLASMDVRACRADREIPDSGPEHLRILLAGVVRPQVEHPGLLSGRGTGGEHDGAVPVPETMTFGFTAMNGAETLKAP